MNIDEKINYVAFPDTYIEAVKRFLSATFD